MQALSAPTVKKPLVFLAISGIVVIVAEISLVDFASKLVVSVPIFFLIFPLPFCFPSNFGLGQWPECPTAQWSWAAILTS